MNRYIMNHRFGLHALTINIEMSDMPTCNQDKIMSEIKNFLGNYPNQEDYWEIVNKKLVIFLSEIFPNQKQIEVVLSIEPDSAKPFSRKSICRINHGKIEKEIFLFSIFNYPLRNNLAALSIEMEYEPNASRTDYVNLFTVKNIIDPYIKIISSSDLPDSLFPEKIAHHLLDHFTAVKIFNVIVEIPPHACNSNRYYWKAFCIRE